MAAAAEPGIANAQVNSDEPIINLPGGLGVRMYRRTDIPFITRHANNKKVWNNLRNRFPHPYTEADSEWWINHTFEESTWVRSGPWTAETGSQGPSRPMFYTITINDEAVGGIGLEFGDAKEIYARTAEIGYWLGEEYWGRGVMSAIVPAFIEWSWRTWGILVRINAEVVDTNLGSRKCLERAGFKVEGKREYAFVKNGQLGNSLFLGALRPAKAG